MLYPTDRCLKRCQGVLYDPDETGETSEETEADNESQQEHIIDNGMEGTNPPGSDIG